MQAKKKLILTVMVIIVIASVYFLYPIIMNHQTVSLYPILSGEPITIGEDEELHFFSEGLIVCGSPSRFYYWDETSMQPPFNQDDLTAESNLINIIAHTENYIVTANNRIYDTQNVPFTLVYENDDHNLWDIKEYSDFLLLLFLDENDIAQPFLLSKNSDFLINLDGTGDTVYISSDSYGKGLSLLMMSINSSVPMTRVFHYENRNELYGVLTLEDQFIYNIYRLENRVILIGIKDILCYNMEGDLVWSLPHDSDGQFSAVVEKESLFLYFPEKSQLGESQGNALLIDEEGYKVKTFPKYLSNIRAFEKGYLALESDHSIVILNSNGEVLKKQTLQDPIQQFEVNSQRPNTLFTLTKENVLQLYTSEKQEEIAK